MIIPADHSRKAFDLHGWESGLLWIGKNWKEL